MIPVRIAITATAGSTPREAGTTMWVWADRTEGTIGGGALEWQAIARARDMLGTGSGPLCETVPLGPSLGQCCGGSVTLDYRHCPPGPAPQGAPLWIYGAGHVGRALVSVLAPLPDFAVTWVDTSVTRFPQVPEGVETLVASDPARSVCFAPQQAHHLVLTYSHQMDLEICHRILSQPFASAGLIGSSTKWARFRGRLRALGHPPEQIARIVCTIGDPRLGKHPQAIAIGVAQALLQTRRTIAAQDV